MTTQLCGLFKSNPMKPPKTTSIEMSGIMALIPPAEPLFVSSVESVSHALKLASFAEDPKNVITQSIMMTRETPTEAADVAAGNKTLITSVRMKAKLQMETPHKMYPPQMNIFLLPILSESAPMKRVVMAAAMADRKSVV